LLDQCAQLTRDRGACAAFTSWAPIERVAALHRSRIALSTGRSGGGDSRRRLAEDPALHEPLATAERQAPYPGNGDFRPDAHTANIALTYLRRHRPKLLFLSLGEPDEYGHRGDYRGYLAALRQSDARIGELARELREAAARGARTALVVTTDHGRAHGFAEHGARYPESARSFVVVAGSAIESFRQRSRADRRLADIAPTLRELFGLDPDTHPQAGASLLEPRDAPVTARPPARRTAAWARADTTGSDPVR
jgi:arylsulfatase A-like enzyme